MNSIRNFFCGIMECASTGNNFSVGNDLDTLSSVRSGIPRRKIYGVGAGAATGAAATFPFLLGAATGVPFGDATGVPFGEGTAGAGAGVSSSQGISMPNPLKKSRMVGHS